MRKLVFIGILLLCKISGFGQKTDDTTLQNNWTSHFQVTVVSQSHFAFYSAYSGTNSLPAYKENWLVSITSTLFIGRKLWRGAAFYYDPEIAGGQGIGQARGIAGFTNGETFRIGNPTPELYTARAFLQQNFALERSHFDTMKNEQNQVAELLPSSRITLSAGKFAVSDFFDNNKYSHDSRTQFLNWSLMNNGAWDYPANTRGYTIGFVTEFIHPTYAFRIGIAQEPTQANGPELDDNILKTHGEMAEIEKSFFIHHQPGTIRVLGFHNITQAPAYRTTLNEVKTGDSSSVNVYTGNLEWKKYGGVKYGFCLSADQAINENLGFFLRSSWNDGKTATWAYTEIDNSVAGGLSVSGKLWKRETDNVGIAFVTNGISKDHRDFLNAGLYGFMIGDGKLTNYGREDIAEIYYEATLFKFLALSADYQFIINPAYNKDRGPVNVYGVRAHIEF